MSTSTALELKRISHFYVNDGGAALALQNLSLTVEQGEFVSLVGPSGCGKTTLLSIIAGIILPTEGSVQVSGHRVFGPSPKVGYMLQQDYLFPWRTIEENAVIGLELNGTLTKENREYVLHLLNQFGLGAQKGKYPTELSGGMRQRVALVRTMAVKPDLLLLDEPFSALDYQTKLQLEDLVFETMKSHGKTAVLVTHDISEAIAMSDRLIVMAPNPGRIRKEIVLPDSIARSMPLRAREQEGFLQLFHDVWNEFDAMESGGAGNAVTTG
ncbi:ABC transporter ATP-binding protein [Paenibacillus gansuensis]|uniref:ABC transporter ATP-binding protein n=1 Tax=Paenibacillus gansuensis TaxID=306542 RepID=A0ABW5PDY3_9BACL